MGATVSFADRLLRWFDGHGRRNLPWQRPREPYRVWVAEVMLQQTQVATVIPYYRRFLRRFPTLAALAAAPLDEVLARWSGLGYYARARNLHRAARIVVAQHAGVFPRDFDAVLALPGIGRSTAGAILAQAFGQRHAILDGNVRRVLARHGGVAGWPGTPQVSAKLWRLAEAHLPASRLPDYTQALMDLGATVCTARTPRCGACPVAVDCVARMRNTIARHPAPRPRRARPRRHAQLLLVRNGFGEWLLERRPERGIWGGLWCPPLVEGRTAPSRPFGARVAARLPLVRHAFTHYDLDLHPLEIRVQRLRTPVPGSDWIAPAALRRYGMPAPVRKLLQNLPVFRGEPDAGA